jgi:hypothetical protein
MYLTAKSAKIYAKFAMLFILIIDYFEVDIVIAIVDVRYFLLILLIGISLNFQLLANR